MSKMHIKSLNGNGFIYDSECGLLIADKCYNEEMINNMKKKYYTIYSEMNKEYFLSEKNNMQIRSLCLILTNQCNFRCKYCINSDMYQYSKGYDNNCMSYDIIDQALKLYVENYKECIIKNPNNKFVILFYGGEPLLQLDKIKYVVEKVEKYYKIKEAIYGVTTNGYLIKRSLVTYFSKHNFFINISLDGYEEIHDLNRVTVDGEPTHKVIINNINETLDLLPVEKYGLLLTLDYQVSPAKMNNYFLENPHLDQRISRINLVSGYNTDYYNKNPKYEMYMEEIQQLFKQYRNKEKATNFTNKFFEAKFRYIEKRMQFSETTCSVCNPMSAKLTVATDGTLHICEKINPNYSIGNVFEGIDKEVALQYYQNLVQLRKENCKNCEVNGLCNICYASINGKGDSFEINDDFCDNQKQNIKQWLTYYCTSLEKTD